MLQSLLAFAIPTVLTLTAAFFLLRNVNKSEEEEQRPRFRGNGTPRNEGHRSSSVRNRRQNARHVECAICMDWKPSVELYPCGHKEFCEDCIIKVIEGNKRVCPLCRKMIKGFVDSAA